MSQLLERRERLANREKREERREKREERLIIEAGVQRGVHEASPHNPNKPHHIVRAAFSKQDASDWT
jgi:hypothetical protein